MAEAVTTNGHSVGSSRFSGGVLINPEQMADFVANLMPEAMDNLLPKMLPQVIPHFMPKMEAHLNNGSE